MDYTKYFVIVQIKNPNQTQKFDWGFC